MRRRWLAAAASAASPPSRAPFSCARFGDGRSATCSAGSAAACGACLLRMYSTSLFALRRCLEFGRLGEHTEGLCAIVEPSPAVSPAGAWLALPASSPAAVRACPDLCVQELFTPSPRRGRWASGDLVGAVGGRCANAVRPPAACCSCAVLGIALVCVGPQCAFWNLKVRW